MAPNIWDDSDVDQDGNNPNNWSLNRVPIAGDIATWDDTSDFNCVFTGNITCDGFNATSVYDGNIQLGIYTYVIGSDGIVLDHTGTFNLGSATVGITGGPFDYKDVGAWNAGNTATVTMNGTCTMIGVSAAMLYNLTFAAGSTVTVDAATTSAVQVKNELTIDGDAVLNDGLWGAVNCDVIVNTGATVSGGSPFLLNAPASGHGLTVHDGTITALMRVVAPASGSVLAPGAFAAVRVENGATSVLILSAGSYSFTSLELQTAAGNSITLNLATNNPTVTVSGDLIIDINSTGDVILDGGSVALTVQGDIIDQITGGGTFTADGQDLTFTGTSAQDIDPVGGTWGAVIVNKASGTATLSGALTCATFTGTSGTLKPNGQTVTTTGNMDWASGFVIDTTAITGSAFVVGGNWTADGQDLSGAAGTWDLQVTGTAVASGVGNVAYSDASGFTEITASAGPWTDGGNNSNWNFGGVLLVQIQKNNLGADLFNGALIV